MRAHVLARDGRCVAAILDERHECQNAFADRHPPDAIHLMTLDHVKEEPRMGVRAPSDPAHLVTMCHHGNLFWAPAHRLDEREYLQRVS